MNYVLVDENNIVVNAIIWDGASSYAPPQGLTLVQTATAGIGMVYDPVSGAFSLPLE